MAKRKSANLRNKAKKTRNLQAVDGSTQWYSNFDSWCDKAMVDGYVFFNTLRELNKPADGIHPAGIAYRKASNTLNSAIGVVSSSFKNSMVSSKDYFRGGDSTFSNDEKVNSFFGYLDAIIKSQEDAENKFYEEILITKKKSDSSLNVKRIKAKFTKAQERGDYGKIIAMINTALSGYQRYADRLKVIQTNLQIVEDETERIIEERTAGRIRQLIGLNTAQRKRDKAYDLRRQYEIAMSQSKEERSKNEFWQKYRKRVVAEMEKNYTTNYGKYLGTYGDAMKTINTAEDKIIEQVIKLIFKNVSENGTKTKSINEKINNMVLEYFKTETGKALSKKHGGSQDAKYIDPEVYKDMLLDEIMSELVKINIQDKIRKIKAESQEAITNNNSALSKLAAEIADQVIESMTAAIPDESHRKPRIRGMGSRLENDKSIYEKIGSGSAAGLYDALKEIREAATKKSNQNELLDQIFNAPGVDSVAIQAVSEIEDLISKYNKTINRRKVTAVDAMFREQFLDETARKGKRGKNRQAITWDSYVGSAGEETVRQQYVAFLKGINRGALKAKASKAIYEAVQEAKSKASHRKFGGKAESDISLGKLRSILRKRLKVVIKPCNIAETMGAAQIEEALKDAMLSGNVTGYLNPKDDFRILLSYDSSLAKITETFGDFAPVIEEAKQKLLDLMSKDRDLEFKKAGPQRVGPGGRTNITVRNQLAENSAFLKREEERKQILSELRKKLTKYRKEIGEEAPDDAEIQLMKDYLADYIDIRGTVKEYRGVQNTIGFDGGSLGSKLSTQIDNILTQYELTGMNINNDAQLRQLLQFIIVNTSTTQGASKYSPIGAGDNKAVATIQELILIGASLMMFDNGGTMLDAYAKKATREVHGIKRSSANDGIEVRSSIASRGMSQLHLYYTNGTYVPGSFVLKAVRDKLRESYNLLNKNATEKLDRLNSFSNGITIKNNINVASYKTHKDDNPEHPTYDSDWDYIAKRADNEVLIMYTFLRNIKQITDMVAKSLKSAPILPD